MEIYDPWSKKKDFRPSGRVSKKVFPSKILKEQDVEQGYNAPFFRSYADEQVSILPDHFSKYLEKIERRNQLTSQFFIEVMDSYGLKEDDGSISILVVDPFEKRIYEVDEYGGGGYLNGSATGTIGYEIRNHKLANFNYQEIDLEALGYPTGSLGGRWQSWLSERYPEYLYNEPYTEVGPGWLTTSSFLDYLVSVHMDLIEVRGGIKIPDPLDNVEYYDVIQVSELPADMADNIVYLVKSPDMLVPTLDSFMLVNDEVCQVVMHNYKGTGHIVATDIEVLNPIDQQDEIEYDSRYWPFDPRIATSYFGNVGWLTPATFQFWGLSIDLFLQYGVLVGNISNTLIRDGQLRDLWTVEKTPIVLMYPKPAFGRQDVLKFPIEDLERDVDRLFEKIKKPLIKYTSGFIRSPITNIVFLTESELISKNLFERDHRSRRQPRDNERVYTDLMEFANDRYNWVSQDWVIRALIGITLEAIRIAVFKLSGHLEWESYYGMSNQFQKYGDTYLRWK